MEPWANSKWSHTDIPRLVKGNLGAQVSLKSTVIAYELLRQGTLRLVELVFRAKMEIQRKDGKEEISKNVIIHSSHAF